MKPQRMWAAVDPAGRIVHVDAHRSGVAYASEPGERLIQVMVTPIHPPHPHPHDHHQATHQAHHQDAQERRGVGMRDQMTLGAMIDALARLNADDRILYDFCGVNPTKVDSYRGYYDHLALGWVEEASEYPKVGPLLENLRAALREEFVGWKGGTHRMGSGTPMWAANRGRTGDTAIVGLRDLGYGHVVIETEYRP